MDFNALSDFISTVGFPVVCFLMCGWYVKYREDKKINLHKIKFCIEIMNNYYNGVIGIDNMFNVL